MDFTYNMLVEHVLCNREIEFSYCNQKYSISNNKHGYFLTEYAGEYQTYHSGEDLLRLGRINEKSLSEIWNDVIIDVVF